MISNKAQLAVGATAVIALLASLGYGALAITQQSRNWETCRNQDHAAAPDARIAACDAVVRSVLLTTDQRATVFTSRGNAYLAKVDFDRALADYDAALGLDPTSAVTFSNRGLAYHHKGDYDRAIADFDAAITLDPHIGWAFFHRARAYQAKGDLPRALADFAGAVTSEPTNAYPALWLYLARARSGDAIATDELAANAKRLKASDWPYAVVELYLGQRTADAMLAASATPDERCEAQFYLGQWDLLRDDRAAAIQALTTAANTCPKDFVEFTDAKAELKRLGQ